MCLHMMKKLHTKNPIDLYDPIKGGITDLLVKTLIRSKVDSVFMILQKLHGVENK